MKKGIILLLIFSFVNLYIPAFAKSHITVNYSNHSSRYNSYHDGHFPHHHIIRPIPYHYINSPINSSINSIYYPTYIPPRMRGEVYNSFYSPKKFVNFGFSI